MHRAQSREHAVALGVEGWSPIHKTRESTHTHLSQRMSLQIPCLKKFVFLIIAQCAFSVLKLLIHIAT